MTMGTTEPGGPERAPSHGQTTYITITASGTEYAARTLRRRRRSTRRASLVRDRRSSVATAYMLATMIDNAAATLRVQIAVSMSPSTVSVLSCGRQNETQASGATRELLALPALDSADHTRRVEIEIELRTTPVRDRRKIVERVLPKAVLVRFGARVRTVGLAQARKHG
jgi:hypothetical protein